MKLYRLVSIIMMLLNHGRVTAGELAEHFEVSKRTIYRDLETINQAGIPIVSHQGINGGFRLQMQQILPKLKRNIMLKYHFV